MTTPSQVRRAAVPIAMLLVLVAASACSRGSKAKAAPEATTTTRPPSYPLTGLPITDPATAARPALSVKISNEAGAFPQAGLDAADVVYEEIIEGDETRYLAIFQSQNADPLGPVRSVRPTDPDLIAPFGGLFGYSGGTERFVTILRATPGITDVGASNASGAYFERKVHRVSWQNHYTSTERLYAQAPPALAPPQRFSPFLPPGQPFAPPGASPALELSVPFGATTAQWEWDAAGGVWNRSHSGDADILESGQRVTATTVIVQFAPYDPVDGATDVTGALVYDAQLVGTGEAWVLANGRLVKGKWSKAAQTDVTSYTDDLGAPIALPAGRTWVELPRTGTPATTEPAVPAAPAGTGTTVTTR